MKAHTIVLISSLVISVGCLGGGYMTQGHWMIIPVLLFMMIFWITTGNKPEVWSASALLLIYVVFAAIGVMVNLSISSMIFGCTSALMSWDLSHFRQSMADIPSNESLVPLEKDHLQSLAVVIFTSLLLTALSSRLSLELPFGAIVFIALLAVGCLTYGLQFILHNPG